MAEQPTPMHTPMSPQSQPGHPAPPAHAEPNVAHEIAQKLRQATVIDNQVTRVVQFTEDEVKAMADALEAQSTSKAPKSEEKK